MFRILCALMLLAALVGCESIDTPIDTGDTGIDTTEVTVTVNAMLNGENVDKQPVSLVDTADESLADGLTGDPITAEFRGQAEVKVGATDAYVTADNRRILTVGDAEYVHRDSFVSADASGSVDVALNRYIYGENVECDFYGDDVYYNTSDEGTIETQDGYKLRLPDALGSGSWLEFDGNDVTLAGDMANNGMELIEFQIEAGHFSFSLDVGYGIDTFECSL